MLFVQQQFQSNKHLKEVCTFGIGGPARLFLEVFDLEQMQQALAFCHLEHLPFFILGKGSNCLFDDRGFDGLVIHNKISYLSFQEHIVEVGAGYSFSMLGLKTAKQGLAGLEFASGIPASVGGAIFMNAGANGQETADCLHEVSFVDERGALHRLSKEELLFSYRHSPFQTKKGAIVSAKFTLTRCELARGKQLAIIEQRKKTQPGDELSAGCVFRNPPGHFAGRLIEQVGLKGCAVGGASISLKHANFIVNQDKASAQEVLALVALVQEKVLRETGIDLQMEIRCIPYQKNP